MNRLIIVGLSALILCSSCSMFHKREKGTGNIVMQSRNVSNFTGVRVSGAMDLYVRQDPGFSVKIETDDNLQQFIIVSEEDGVVRIRQENNVNLDPTRKIKVFVSAPTLNRLLASGACAIYTENMITSPDPFDIDLSGASEARVELKSPRVSADLSGASTLFLKGETKQFSIDGSGSSNVRCFDLLTEETTIDVSGACNAEVFASVKLDVKASGASEIKYRGNASVSQDVSGAGSVKKVE